MKRAALLTALCLLALVAACKRNPGRLHLLVWEGYGAASFIKPFEAECRCTVEVNYFTSSDDLLERLRGPDAARFDLISPSSDVAATIAATGLAAPLDLSKVPSYGQLSPRLRGLGLVKWHGRIYGVPSVWGPNTLLYDTRAFAAPPESWSVLWDPAYRGKVSLWNDVSSLYLAATLLGYDRPDSAVLYNLTDEQLERVQERLLALEPNRPRMWSEASELDEMFHRREVVAAMGWSLVARQLRRAKFPIGETIPRENTTGWLDHVMIPAASRNQELAYRFIEYLIQPRAQRELAETTGCIPANPHAAEVMSASERKDLHLDEADAYQQRIYFWEDVPRRQRYVAVWNDVKARLTSGLPGDGGMASTPMPPEPMVRADATPVTMVYSSEKQAWLEEAAASFRREHPEIRLTLVAEGSLEAERAIVGGKLRPTVFSPSDTLVLDLLASDWRAARRSEPFATVGEDAPVSLVVTPLVYVAWAERAQVLAPKGEVRWQALHRIASAPQGWAGAGGRAEWGPLKLGHTDPSRALSGLQTLYLTALEFFHRPVLAPADLGSADYQAWLQKLEQAVIQFDPSTGELMSDLLRFGPSKYDVTLVYENLALAELEAAPGRWGQHLRVLYPSSTVWSDHPAVVLTAPWVTPAERKAARVWLAHLGSRAVQERALAFGFRPGNPTMPVASVATDNPFLRLARFGVRVDLPPVARPPGEPLARALLALGKRMAHGP